MVYGVPITIAAVLTVSYSAIAILLAVAAKYDIRWLSAVMSMLSFLFHLAIALGIGILAAMLVYGVASSLAGSSQPAQIEIAAYLPTEMSSGVTTFLWITGVLLAIELLIWMILLSVTLSRSLNSFSASLRGVPGLYEYGYGTRVFSSSRMEIEMEFLADALNRSRGYSKSDVEEITEDEDRYLVRFASRNGDLVAASLQELPDYNLVALFGGEGSRSLNLEVLLEDSFHIQKLRVAEARASLRKDELISEIAIREGWTVETRDSLMSLHRS